MSSQQTHVSPSPQGRDDRPMAWLLITAGVLVAALCALAPAVADRCQAVEEATRARMRVERLRAEVDRQERIIEAIRNDPGVNVQLAKIHLNYHRPDETVVPIRAPHTPVLGPESLGATQHELPAPAQRPQHLLGRAERLARRYGLLDVATDRLARPILLMAALGALGAGVMLARG